MSQLKPGLYKVVNKNSRHNCKIGFLYNQTAVMASFGNVEGITRGMWSKKWEREGMKHPVQAYSVRASSVVPVRLSSLQTPYLKHVLKRLKISKGFILGSRKLAALEKKIQTQLDKREN